MEVLKVVVVLWGRWSGRHGRCSNTMNCANFQVLFPPDIIADNRTALRIREKQLGVLTSEHPEVDWGNILDERVLTSNGLRLLGSLKYKEIPSAKDRSKRYKELEADVAGSCYVPCQIDLERCCVTDKAIRVG